MQSHDHRICSVSDTNFEDVWLRSVAASGAFAFLADPAQDMYKAVDGEAFHEAVQDEMTQVRVHYSERLIRSTIKAFWWRTTGWSYFLTFSFLLACFGLLVWSGDRSWRIGLMGAILGIGVAFAAILYFVHCRGSLNRLRRMSTPEATMELGEDRFRVASDVGTSEMRWSVVTELWRFPEFWLLFFSKAQFITLPTADLDLPAREFIIAKLRSHAVKIT